MKVMISQPMNGLTDEKIERVRNETKKKLEDLGHEVVDSKFSFSDGYLRRKGVKHLSLHYLAVSLMTMATCDAVYFCKGWKQARGCVIEYEAAKQYGLEVMGE